MRQFLDIQPEALEKGPITRVGILQKLWEGNVFHIVSPFPSDCEGAIAGGRRRKILVPDQAVQQLGRHLADCIHVEPSVRSCLNRACNETALPAASVQTLADCASSFATEFETKSESRTVGIPLLVHRRCEEPMFSVSNAIGYSGLMVQAKRRKDSAIREVLGKSRWIHIQGGGDDKWCAEEGEEVVRLLRMLVGPDAPLDLYVCDAVRHRR